MNKPRIFRIIIIGGWFGIKHILCTNSPLPTIIFKCFLCLFNNLITLSLMIQTFIVSDLLSYSAILFKVQRLHSVNLICSLFVSFKLGCRF